MHLSLSNPDSHAELGTQEIIPDQRVDAVPKYTVRHRIVLLYILYNASPSVAALRILIYTHSHMQTALSQIPVCSRPMPVLISPPKRAGSTTYIEARTNIHTLSPSNMQQLLRQSFRCTVILVRLGDLSTLPRSGSSEDLASSAASFCISENPTCMRRRGRQGAYPTSQEISEHVLSWYSLVRGISPIVLQPPYLSRNQEGRDEPNSIAPGLG
ncbi:hypothetical protein K505DRAFT_62904 [Melanomma pulvis-pyrius CBS 109.77]|uniref:Uncharacterized protein n=1 Tax=Melanomma pulvis-pyrius CBS 109.77 TaxID=1314802 RepID=A0A6A6XT73_9PLEO|nr:hypothetical protein K505DRAFT_62904 [Melanomma pulvis-pyrius CBS 109.77]